jgi:thiol:disulfide interchange protein DsbD
VSQIYEPVKWNFSKQQISDSSYELIFTADIDPGWAIYSNDILNGGVDCDIEICPIPVSFEFNKMDSNEISFKGGIIEIDKNKSSSQDPIFLMKVTKFIKKATFKQLVEIKNKDAHISGFLTYMTCDDTKCLPPTDVDFSFNFGSKKQESNGDQAIKDLEENMLNLYGFSPDQINESFDSCNTNSANTIKSNSSLINIFFLGLIGGLLALLTPCVFPMIPLTVSFFTKKDNNNGTRNAIIYGLFIFLVYILLSVPFHLLDSVNPDILNDISTNITLNIFFFLIFLLFAFSFFGFFDLTLPSSWVTSSTNKESTAGIIGIFFMALTLAIVSFSCTGPILGSLLAGSLTADSGAWQLTVGMGGFGLALGLPFALFALFPKFLEKLPSSGGWLNTLKVTLGFVELALALKFLSNADLVAHWGILKIELFLGLWFLIFFTLGIYLLGKIKFPKDSPVNKISNGRLISATFVIIFSFYLASGLIYNFEKKSFRALSLLSGLAPPLSYSYFFPSDCPNNLNCFKDLKTGMDYARSVNKPILLDFTGYACVNCRKMEEHVWPLKDVDKLIRDEFVLISLYVDDKKSLADFEKINVNRISGKGVRTLENYGHKWAYFQARYFNVNSQPYYLIMDPDSYSILNSPVGYTPDKMEYVNFLNCGLSSFKELNKN